MKTMIRVIAAVFVFNFLCTSCWDDPDIPNIESKMNGLTTEISGELYIDSYNEELLSSAKCDNIQNCLSGTGNSTAEGLKEISMDCSYNLTILDAEQANQVQLNGGDFKLYDDGINEIYGTFRGCGGYCDDIFSVELLFDVTGGAGYYQNATGIINGKIIRLPEYPKILYLKINGIVNHSFTGY